MVYNIVLSITGCLSILESLTLTFNFSSMVEFYGLKIVQEMQMNVVFLLHKYQENSYEQCLSNKCFSEKTQKFKMKIGQEKMQNSHRMCQNAWQEKCYPDTYTCCLFAAKN